MKLFFIGIFFALSTLTLGACTEIISGRNVSNVDGTVFYLPRIALPENAKLTVTLSDVSLKDRPAEVISSHSYITEGQQIPLPFNLNYATSDIKPGHTYSVSAKIEVGGDIIFISDMENRVITDPKNTKNIKVQLKQIN